MAEPESDTIRLSVPPDADMRPVVEVAIGVLARRWGLSDDEVATARAATGDALVEMVHQGGADPVTIEVRMTRGSLVVRIASADAERTVTLP